MQQVQSMLTQLFDALKESLTVAIQHGLIAILVVCVGMVVATFFLKDIPMAKEFASGTADGTQPAAADGAQPIEASTAQSVGADGTQPVEASTIQPEASDKNKPVS
jgi:hypothetical protein